MGPGALAGTAVAISARHLAFGIEHQAVDVLGIHGEWIGASVMPQ